VDGQTLVAIISTNRSEMEYLARTRAEIIETFDALILDAGDVIQLQMRFVDNSEVVGLPEAGHTQIVEWEAGGVMLPLSSG
jgi:hypothetical protein